MELKSLLLNDIDISSGTQVREFLDRSVIEKYAELMESGIEFPPVIVFYDQSENKYYLADGFLRYKAVEFNDAEEIKAEIRQGSLRDAILHACFANGKHGLPLTNSDKIKVVTIFLEDEEWKKWSDREIARKSGVSHTFVSKIRNEICETPSGNGCQIKRKVQRGDQSYVMNTSGIINLHGNKESEQQYKHITVQHNKPEQQDKEQYKQVHVTIIKNNEPEQQYKRVHVQYPSPLDKVIELLPRLTEEEIRSLQDHLQEKYPIKRTS